MAHPWYTGRVATPSWANITRRVADTPCVMVDVATVVDLADSLVAALAPVHAVADYVDGLLRYAVSHRTHCDSELGSSGLGTGRDGLSASIHELEGVSRYELHMPFVNGSPGGRSRVVPAELTSGLRLVLRQMEKLDKLTAGAFGARDALPVPR